MVVRLTKAEIQRAQKTDRERRYRWWRRQVKAEAIRKLRERV